MRSSRLTSEVPRAKEGVLASGAFMPSSRAAAITLSSPISWASATVGAFSERAKASASVTQPR
ncbi:hypothetical protein D9M68_387640 [compost metagenome]